MTRDTYTQFGEKLGKLVECLSWNRLQEVDIRLAAVIM